MKRTRVRSSDLRATLAALEAAGVKPVALDTLPDGTNRWHFVLPVENDEVDLDKELAEFERKHGGD